MSRTQKIVNAEIARLVNEAETLVENAIATARSMGKPLAISIACSTHETVPVELPVVREARELVEEAVALAKENGIPLAVNIQRSVNTGPDFYDQNQDDDDGWVSSSSCWESSSC